MAGADRPAFEYDFATLCDMVGWHSAAATPNARWRIGVRLDGETGCYFICAVKGPGDAAICEAVQGTDFDLAAARIAPRLARRDAIPSLTPAP